jgi:ketosteroid isomerase-like protein
MLSNIQIVDRMETVGHDRESSEAREAHARFMSPDLKVIEPGSLPYGGVFQGAAQLQEFDQLFFETWSHHEYSVVRYADHGEWVAVAINLRLVARTTGREVTSRIAEWWRVVDGKVVEIEIFYEDTAAILAAITP